jgi:hypothetical protein
MQPVAYGKARCAQVPSAVLWLLEMPRPAVKYRSRARYSASRRPRRRHGRSVLLRE